MPDGSAADPASAVIYLVRHGETQWNVEGRVQGHLDSPLTARGVEQARQAGRTLAALLVDEAPFVLRHSPLGRVRRTTALIRQTIDHRLSAVQVDPGLIEISWGRWEGLTRTEIAARDGELWAWREADRWHHPPPGGESHAMLTARARAWLDTVTGADRLIVVAHGAFGRALRAAYLRLTPAQAATLDEPQDALFRLTAATITRFSYVSSPC